MFNCKREKRLSGACAYKRKRIKDDGGGIAQGFPNNTNKRISFGVAVRTAEALYAGRTYARGMSRGNDVVTNVLGP